MKKLIIILLCLVFASCHVTYDVTTQEDFTKAKNEMLAVSSGYGYSWVKADALDTTLYVSEDQYTPIGYFTHEQHVFSSGKDTVLLDLRYRHRAITEVRTIPYVEQITVGCSGNAELCDTLCNLFTNPPKTKTRVVTEESLVGTLIGAMILPIVSFLTFTVVNDGHSF